jgi:hypothetical protein
MFLFVRIFSKLFPQQRRCCCLNLSVIIVMYCKKRGSVRINVTLRCVRLTTVPVERNRYYVLWVCVCTLVLQHAMHTGRIILSHIAYMAVLYFSILINSTIFGNTLLSIRCVFKFSLQILSKTFIILRRI